MVGNNLPPLLGDDSLLPRRTSREMCDDVSRARRMLMLDKSPHVLVVNAFSHVSRGKLSCWSISREMTRVKKENVS